MKLIGATTAFFVTLAFPVWAQEQSSNCIERSIAIEQLAGKYGEHRVWIGIHKDGQSIMESFANAETGTWTVTVTDHNGVLCVVAYGSDYQADGPSDEAPTGEAL